MKNDEMKVFDSVASDMRAVRVDVSGESEPDTQKVKIVHPLIGGVVRLQ
jgi:hypothetical protein